MIDTFFLITCWPLSFWHAPQLVLLSLWHFGGWLWFGNQIKSWSELVQSVIVNHICQLVVVCIDWVLWLVRCGPKPGCTFSPVALKLPCRFTPDAKRVVRHPRCVIAVERHYTSRSECSGVSGNQETIPNSVVYPSQLDEISL